MFSYGASKNSIRFLINGKVTYTRRLMFQALESGAAQAPFWHVDKRRNFDKTLTHLVV